MNRLTQSALVLTALVLTGCTAPQPPGASAAPSSAPSATIVATATPTAAPTLVPTAAATSSATATATGATATAIATSTTQASATPTTSSATASATSTAEPATATAAPATATTAAATATATAATATATPIAAPATATPTGATGGGAVRPDLRGTIVFERGGNIYAYRPQTGAVTQLIQDGRDVQLSRDGAQLAFVRDDGLYLAAADGSGARRIVEQSGISSPRWTDDGSKLVFERVKDPSLLISGEIWTIELAQGTALKIANGGDPAWAPDGKRLAYVTTQAADGTRRNELHLINWRGQNDWAVVRRVPANTPPTGIPGGEIAPGQLEHLLFAPVWSADGKAIYVLAVAASQVETDFILFERADATNGGSTYLETLLDARDALATPDRRGTLITTASARGDISLRSRTLDPALGQNAYAWANAGSLSGPVYQFFAPAWSPGSDALATIRCGEQDISQGRCDLVLLAPGQSEPAVLIADVLQGAALDYTAPPTLSWGQ